jgi:hypothetical protein
MLGLGAAIAPIIPVLFPEHKVLAVLVSPLLYWVFRTLYDNVPGFSVTVRRLWLCLTNARVNWSLSVDYTVTANQTTLPRVIQALVDGYPGTKTMESTDSFAFLQLPDLGIVRVSSRQVPEYDSTITSHLLIDFQEIAAPFRHADGLVEQISQLMEDHLESAVDASARRFTCKVRFGQSNPYYGLYIQRLAVPKQDAVRYHIEFEDSIGTRRERIHVSERQLSFVTDNLMSWSRLARRYITLAEVPAA